MRVLFELWIFAAFSDVFAEGLLIWAFWKRREESWVGFYWSAAVAGVLLENLLSLIAMLSLSGENALEIAGGEVLIRMIGRSAKAVGFWAMALKVLRGTK